MKQVQPADIFALDQREEQELMIQKSPPHHVFWPFCLYRSTFRDAVRNWLAPILAPNQDPDPQIRVQMGGPGASNLERVDLLKDQNIQSSRP